MKMRLRVRIRLEVVVSSFNDLLRYFPFWESCLKTAYMRAWIWVVFLKAESEEVVTWALHDREHSISYGRRRDALLVSISRRRYEAHLAIWNAFFLKQARILAFIESESLIHTAEMRWGRRTRKAGIIPPRGSWIDKEKCSSCGPTV